MTAPVVDRQGAVRSRRRPAPARPTRTGTRTTRPTAAPVSGSEAVCPVQVVGVYCKQRHFNDPQVPYCTVCGIGMTQATRQPVHGLRPQLGVLVLDDGSTLSLCADQVIGRAPHGDPAVQAGTALAVAVADPTVSAVHARIQLDGWDVRLVDAGSANGTFVWGPADTAWRRLASGSSVLLQPGTAVAVGRRQLCYLSYRNSYLAAAA